MNNFYQYFILMLKGAAMGAANVIPGVSGGTIAFITGIYETLIDSIKSFDIKAGKLLLSFKFGEFIEYINLKFLLSLFLGVAISILSLARLLEFLLIKHEQLTLAFFFGLIIASIYLVGKQINRWDTIVFILLILGTAIAGMIAFLKPATENDNMMYVFICGIVAACSMILPGLSGSYILLIMGNYLLILRAVSGFEFSILIPLFIGCGVGLLGFSHLLAFVFRKFHNETVALLTGFVLGSLVIIWPWKRIMYLKDEVGEFITKKDGELIEAGYQWFLPNIDVTLFIAVVLILVGMTSVIVIEKFGEKRNETA